MLQLLPIYAKVIMMRVGEAKETTPIMGFNLDIE